MTPGQRALYEELRKRRCCGTVIDRVLRLNPDGCREGVMLRGWHRKRDIRFERNLISRGDVIRRLGRHAWNWVDADEVVKDGRREYISYRYYRNCLA